MAQTLSDILIAAGAVIDLSATEPVNDDLSTRVSYADQAVWDAVAKGRLHEFSREHLTTSSTLATIPLPSDFHELEENPMIYSNGGWVEYKAIKPRDKYAMEASDKYCYVMGNPADGYNLIFNNIVVSDQVSILYQRFPSGFATLTDICELADPQYVVRKIEAYVLYSRTDERFPQANAIAEQSLANMMGRGSKGPGGMGNTTPVKFKNPLG